MSTATEEGRGPGLATRFFVGAAVVIVVTVGLSVALASSKAEGVARERIRGELLRVPALFAGWRDSQMSARRAQVRAVAEQPGTKALLAERGGSAETAHDTSLEFARALGAAAVFLFDTHGRLIVRTDRPQEEGGRDFAGVTWVSLPLARLTESSAFIAEVSHGPALSLVASAPVLQGAGTERVLNGVLSAAFRMDDERGADGLAAAGEDRDQRGQVVAASRAQLERAGEVAAGQLRLRGAALRGDGPA
ncbi:MAG TPA: hypothetical protein VFK70_09935, partial [Vicinamibacteria bacterium]|nr:hypothetical protein [Vicinamibacteria bacterium]